jgi:regulator of nucleoside diphosphate kinase
MNNTPSSIHLASEDLERLRLLAGPAARTGAPRNSRDGGATLRGELDRAVVLPRALLPAGTVSMGARTRFVDLASGEIEEYTLSWPERADAALRRLSVLAPVGTAVLGCRVGDEVAWPTPGGMRQLRILEVEAGPAVGAEERSDSGVESFLQALRSA